MLLQAVSSLPSAISFPNSHSNHHRRNAGLLLRVALSVSGLNGAIGVRFRRGRNRKMTISASIDPSYNPNVKKKRKVVEHICLLKAERDLSEEDENGMLDYLYTSQYQMRGIVAISLGRISGDSGENYTHAVFMRFQRKEDVTKFYENPFYLKVLKEHVMPHCHVCPDMD